MRFSPEPYCMSVLFKRLHDQDDSVKGTGAGLTFIKKMIERRKGRIWIEPEIGKGTTTLPNQTEI